MLPTLGIMQALTNAAFLPYLATREPESTSSLEDLSNHKLSIDTEEDYKRVKKIFNFFNNILIGYKNVLKKLS